VEEAFREARVAPEEIDYVNAHGTSTPLNDRLETLGLKRCLGEHARRVPISSIKSMIGHTTTACGAIDTIATVMSLRTGILPPTINYEHPDPECDLDYVPNTAREHPCRTVLSHNFGFGGHNAALVLRRV
jgi:3-oxoacyl-[acyl-carrier-protein] synthase II